MSLSNVSTQDHGAAGSQFMSFAARHFQTSIWDVVDGPSSGDSSYQHHKLRVQFLCTCLCLPAIFICIVAPADNRLQALSGDIEG